MTLHRLLYYSSNRIAGSGDNLHAEIEQILSSSRRNNRLVGVTGALMFSAGFFGQVLEGEAAAIETTFERIQQDLRHSDVVLLEFRPVLHRSFSDWDMAYVGSPEAVFDRWANGSVVEKARSAEALFSRLHALVARASPAG